MKEILIISVLVLFAAMGCEEEPRSMGYDPNGGDGDADADS